MILVVGTAALKKSQSPFRYRFIRINSTLLSEDLWLWVIDAFFYILALADSCMFYLMRDGGV